MKTISTISDSLTLASNQFEERMFVKQQEIQKQLDDLEFYKVFMKTKRNHFSNLLTQISEILRKHGFEIESVNGFTKTGNPCIQYEVKDDDKLKCDIYLKMCGRRKPLKFQGYTSSGTDKRRNRMQEITSGVYDEMKEKLNISCSINPYSLEKESHILCDIFF